MEKYRIVQTSDNGFHVQKCHIQHQQQGWLWWRCTVVVEEWRNRFYPAPDIPFRTQEAAQKWVDDQRKYPIIVKDPA